MLFLQEFPTHELAAEWLSVVSLLSSVFLLLTYAVLAPEKSHRHYLSVGLIVSNVLLQVCARPALNANFIEADYRSSWPLSFH
jgi:hypothetical protein